MSFLLVLQLLSVEPLPWPTRAEVIAYNLDESKTRCLTAREPDGKLCANAERPVVITGKELDKLAKVLRGHESFDRGSAARCFDPHHSVVFFYETSSLDTYEICFKCHNTEPGGSRPPCEGNQCVDHERLTFTDGALKSVQKIFKSAKVKGARF